MNGLLKFIPCGSVDDGKSTLIGHMLYDAKLLFADQSALYRCTDKKLLLPRRYNEQSRFDRKDTVVCHFCKRLMFRPYPHTENYKQWQVEEIHRYLHCHAFDRDLEEYQVWKQVCKEIPS